MEEEAPMGASNDLIADFLDLTGLECELSPDSLIKEEMIEEVMQELCGEITCPSQSPSPSLPSVSSYCTGNIRAYLLPEMESTLPPSALPFPLSSALSFLSASSLPSSASSVTTQQSSSSLSSSAPSLVDNGKSQTCPASFSDIDSTMVAGVDFMQMAEKMAAENVGSPENGATAAEEEKWRESGEGDVMMIVEGCDGGDFSDEWLEMVLTSWAPEELEGRTRFDC